MIYFCSAVTCKMKNSSGAGCPQRHVFESIQRTSLQLPGCGQWGLKRRSWPNGSSVHPPSLWFTCFARSKPCIGRTLALWTEKHVTRVLVSQSERNPWIAVVAFAIPCCIFICNENMLCTYVTYINIEAHIALMYIFMYSRIIYVYYMYISNVSLKCTYVTWRFSVLL